jgi:hypothetical protein
VRDYQVDDALDANREAALGGHEADGLMKSLAVLAHDGLGISSEVLDIGPFIDVAGELLPNGYLVAGHLRDRGRGTRRHLVGRRVPVDAAVPLGELVSLLLWRCLGLGSATLALLACGGLRVLVLERSHLLPDGLDIGRCLQHSLAHQDPFLLVIA